MNFLFLLLYVQVKLKYLVVAFTQWVQVLNVRDQFLVVH